MIQKDSLMNDGWLLTIDENSRTGKSVELFICIFR